MSDHNFPFEPADGVRYVGPSTIDSPYAAPPDWKMPYEFKHVSVGGTLTLETTFNGRKRLAPDHPANDPDNWEKVGE